MRRLAIFVVLGSGLCGCSHPDSSASPSVAGGPTPASSLSNPPAAPSTAPSSAPVSSAVVSKPAMALTSLAQELRSDAYEYYGLGNDKPVKLAFRKDSSPVPMATRTVKLVAVKDGKASFEEQQIGGLEDETQTMSLEPDGLYVMAASSGTLKTPHTLELPSKLSKGTEWQDNQELESQGTTIKLDGKYRVVGFEDVKTQAGPFPNALHVVGAIKGTRGGVPVSMSVEDWYAKGIGLVKQRLTVSGTLKVTVTSEATK